MKEPMEIERLVEDMKRGGNVSLLVSPAAQKHFGDYRPLFGALRELFGFRSFYNVGDFADVVVWAYSRIFESRRGASFIASACPAVLMHIRQHIPQLKSRIMPVVSPVVATALYLKSRGVEDHFAFLTPCIFKKYEIEEFGREPSGIHYCITIAQLQEHLLRRRIQLELFPGVEFSKERQGPAGQTFAVTGGIGESLQLLSPGFRYEKACGAERVYTLLRSYAMGPAGGEEIPDLMELNHCSRGCDSGAGIGSEWPFLSPNGGCAGTTKASSGDLHSLWEWLQRELYLADYLWKAG